MNNVAPRTPALRPSWLWRHLPRGSALPEDVWWQRHRGILILLWLHVPVILAVALVQGVGPVHAAFETAIIVSLATLATASRQHRRLSTVIAAVGLLTCSAELVHLSHGLIEMHFHYFVMVGVVTLYQDWQPFLISIGYVVLQHGAAGAISPASVYNHPEAVSEPWKWAGIHGAFILGMSAAGIISWRLNESLLEAATEREGELAEAQSVARLGSWIRRQDTGMITLSRLAHELFGLDPDVEVTAELLLTRLHPDDRETFRGALAQSARGAPLSFDFRVVLPGGEERWLHSRGEVTAWDGALPATVSGTVQDVTERRTSEDALRASESELRDTLSLLNATLESTADGILVVDVEGQISSFNHRFTEMWSIPDDVLASRDDSAALGFVLGQLVDPDGFVAKVTELYAQPDAESYDTLAFKDGRVVERYSKPQRVGGETVGRVWSFRDVSGQRQLEAELAHQAFHDSLTDLANQALFRDRVDHALARVARRGGHLAVVFLDLDNFKTVNDSLGHTVGDQLLVGVTERLQGCLRQADTAARLGGDEFAVLLEDTTGTAEAIEVAERTIAALRQPFLLSGKEVFVSTSLGIAMDSPGIECDQLLRNADLAMYTAKSLGKGRFEVFAPEMHVAAVERLDLEADLRRAIERTELRLHYQPIVSLQTGEMVGVEALVRWQHPDRGLLPPDQFIELAEECGLIEPIGHWVLEEACAQTLRWQVEHPRLSPLSVSVNLSPRQLRDPKIVQEVSQVLAGTGLPAASLTLEITEGAMMHDTEVALSHLSALKQLGLRLAVDDFGTGYSSLSYLQRFPIDVLKIDKTFVQRIDRGPEESSLARAIVRLAQTLHLTAVAEGVENLEQGTMLRRLGCELGQGYYMSRPQGAEVITEYLATERRFVLGSEAPVAIAAG